MIGSNPGPVIALTAVTQVSVFFWLACARRVVRGGAGANAFSSLIWPTYVGLSGRASVSARDEHKLRVLVRAGDGGTRWTPRWLEAAELILRVGLVMPATVLCPLRR